MSDFNEKLARAGAILFSGVSAVFALGAVTSMEVAYGLRRLASTCEAYITGVIEDHHLYRLVTPWNFLKRVIGAYDTSDWKGVSQHVDERGPMADDSREEAEAPEEDPIDLDVGYVPNPEAVTSSRESSSEVSH